MSDRPDVERLASAEPHEVGVGLEERERGAQHPLDLGPALDQVADRVVDDREPVRERLLEHRAVERVLRREVVQQARPADPDLVGDLAQARGRQPVVGEAAPGDVEDQRLGVVRRDTGHVVGGVGRGHRRHREERSVLVYRLVGR